MNENQLSEWRIACLAKVPVSDCNFTGARKKATLAEARAALAIAEGASKRKNLEALVRRLERSAR